MCKYVTVADTPILGTSIFKILNYGVSDGTFIPNGAIEINADISSDLSAYAVDMSSGESALIDMPAEISQQITREATANLVREKRDRLIAVTDYLLMPDYPVTEERLAALKIYRQALRDVTQQVGFPDDIEWPIE